MRVLICGGGTGGHIYPGLALARYLLDQDKNSQILFVGTNRGLETRVIPRAGFNLEVLPVRAFTKSTLQDKTTTVLDLFRSIKQARDIIKNFKPQVVVGTGGYAAAPVCVASILQRLPVILHEQNAIPGRTNRLLGSKVRRICVSFSDTQKYFPRERTIFTGNPRASEVAHISKEEGKKRLKELDPQLKTMLVFGGSQGAKRLNQVMVEFIRKKTIPLGYQILYITGELYYDEIISELKETDTNRLIIKPYLDDMPAAMAASDIAITRAGATAIAELTAIGLPAILVPSPNVAHNHQYYNALMLENNGAAKIIEEKDFTQAYLSEQLEKILGDPGLMEKMALQSKNLGMTDAAGKMYECIKNEVFGNHK